MGVKGDKFRGGWNREWENNFNKIFGDKNTMRTTPKMYLEMWLSEQIPLSEWMRILEERKDVKMFYNSYKEKKNEVNRL